MTGGLDVLARRKMFSKVRVTEVVPAPDEPVMAMMGCFRSCQLLQRIARDPRRMNSPATAVPGACLVCVPGWSAKTGRAEAGGALALHVPASGLRAAGLLLPGKGTHRPRQAAARWRSAVETRCG